MTIRHIHVYNLNELSIYHLCSSTNSLLFKIESSSATSLNRYSISLSLQPYVSYVLYAVAGLLGILNHYLWPQLHKPLPWLCFARPFLRSREFNQYEVKGR